MANDLDIFFGRVHNPLTHWVSEVNLVENPDKSQDSSDFDVKTGFLRPQTAQNDSLDLKSGSTGRNTPDLAGQTDEIGGTAMKTTFDEPENPEIPVQQDNKSLILTYLEFIRMNVSPQLVIATYGLNAAIKRSEQALTGQNDEELAKCVAELAVYINGS